MKPSLSSWRNKEVLTLSCRPTWRTLIVRTLPPFSELKERLATIFTMVDMGEAHFLGIGYGEELRQGDTTLLPWEGMAEMIQTDLGWWSVRPPKPQFLQGPSSTFFCRRFQHIITLCFLSSTGRESCSQSSYLCTHWNFAFQGFSGPSSLIF